MIMSNPNKKQQATHQSQQLRQVPGTQGRLSQGTCRDSPADE